MKIEKPGAKPPPEISRILFSGEDLAKLTIPELIQIMDTILQEIEIRVMEQS